MEQALIFFWRPNLWPPCRKGTQNYFDDLLSCPVLSCSAPVIAQPRFFYTWILAVEILRIHKMLLFRISVCSVNCTWSKPTYVYKKWSPNVWQLAMRVLCNYVIHIWTWVETYGVLSYTSQFSVIHTILRSIYWLSASGRHGTLKVTRVCHFCCLQLCPIFRGGKRDYVF